MLKKIVACAAIMSSVVTALSTTTFAAENSFVNNSANYTAEAKSNARFYQSNGVAVNADMSKVEVKGKEVPYTTITEESDKLTKGTTKVVQKGVNGVNKITETNTYVNNEVAEVTYKEEVVKEPVDEIVHVGTKEVPTIPNLSTPVEYSKVLNMNATAYCPCSRCCGSYSNGYTANGMKAGYGVVAVDRKVIPLGTKLYVEGYGYCVAADTGGAIKGNRIDLCYGSHSAALASGFGHKNVKVYVLG